MLKSIKSLKNPVVKQILLLQEKARERKESGLFVVEGSREIRMALEGGFILEKLLFAEHMARYFDAEKLLLHHSEKSEIIEISREVHLRLCIREGTEPFLAIFQTKNELLQDISLKPGPVTILVAEAPEKPGNIGALLRTADGAGVDMVLIANPKTDLYNPNIIRSSLGCLFSLPVFQADTNTIIEFLNRQEIGIFAASLEASVPYTEIKFPERSAIVVGAEDKGLSSAWVEKSTHNIIIPMRGKVDSLNVSVSAGILLYEVLRQRSL